MALITMRESSSVKMAFIVMTTGARAFDSESV